MFSVTNPYIIVFVASSAKVAQGFTGLKFYICASDINWFNSLAPTQRLFVLSDANLEAFGAYADF